MPDYLLELYVSRDDPELAARGGRRIREAAEHLTQGGTPVRYCRSLFVPDEEVCFVLVEADSIDAVRDAARLAGMPYDRVSAAISHPTHLSDQESA